MADVRSLIAAYLQEAKLMQVATVSEGQPWVCSVWFAADEDLNIYWFSRGSRRHSKEVERNGSVAGAIALPQAPSDDPRGLQFQGVAAKLIDAGDVGVARSLYQDRIFSAEKIDKLIGDEADPHFFYKIDVSEFVLFDAVNFPDSPRQAFSS